MFQCLLKSITYKLVVCFAIASLFGCQSGKSGVDVKGVSEPLLNINRDGESTPVAIAFVPIKEKIDEITPEVLEKYLPLYQVAEKKNPDVHEMTVWPNETFDVNLKLDPDVEMLGVIGYFKNPDISGYRDMILLKKSWKNIKLSLRVYKNRLVISKPKKKKKKVKAI